jgi:hypothetical protein
LLGGALLTAALVAGPGASAAFADSPTGGRPEAPAGPGAGPAQAPRPHLEPERGRPQDAEQEPERDPADARSLEHRSGFVGAVVDPNPGAKTFGLRVTAGGAPTTLTVALDADTAFPGAAEEDATSGSFFARLADLGSDARVTVVARERTDAGRLLAERVVVRAAGGTADES